jgi:hypothetical protein
MFDDRSNFHGLYRYFCLSICQRILKILPRLSHRRSILFLAHAHLSEYCLSVWKLLGNDARLNARSIEFTSNDHQDIDEKLVPGKIIRARWAYLCRWDIVIIADHPSGTVMIDLCNKKYWPTLRIQHGIMGKKVDGRAYTYSQLAYDSGGNIRYTRIFAPSEYEKKIAVGYDRKFENVVGVVGSLQDDELIEMNHHRIELRESMGIRIRETVIFIVSTWGENSLFRKWGAAIISEAKNIAAKYRFIVSIHPLEYLYHPAGKDNIIKQFNDLRDEGFIVREPGEDWKKYLVISDLIITDHTALSVHGALIRRPFVYVPIPEEVIAPESPISKLKNISPVLSADARDLQDKINDALTNYPYGLLKDVSMSINSCTGESEQRIRNEIYKLMDLEAPQEGRS